MLLRDNRFPSVEECFELMERYHMLPNIREHSIIVADIATLLAERLSASGVQLSAEKVIAGALLHDIGKTACLNSNENHAEKGREICIAEQLRSVVDIVAEHVIIKDYDPNTELTEKEIVYYADKRVNHDKIVELSERLEYILERYGKDNPQRQQAIRKNFNRCVTIEKRIFSYLDFKPEQLGENVTNRI